MVHDWGWPKDGPFWTNNGLTWQACQRFKMVNVTVSTIWDHFWPIWTLLNNFRLKMIVLPQKDKVGFSKHHWFTKFSGKDVTKWIPHDSYLWIYSTIQISFIFQMLGRKDFSLLLSFSFILISRQASGSRKNVLFIGSDDLRPNLGFFDEVQFYIF